MTTAPPLKELSTDEINTCEQRALALPYGDALALLITETGMYPDTCCTWADWLKLKHPHSVMAQQATSLETTA